MNNILTVKMSYNSLGECVDDSHALVLKGFLYGTKVNITCLKKPCLFAVPSLLKKKKKEWLIKTWVNSD